MSGEGRYSTSGMIEGQFEPGTNGQVLKNLLGINNCAELERVETERLYDFTDQLLDECYQNTVEKVKTTIPQTQAVGLPVYNLFHHS